MNRKSLRHMLAALLAALLFASPFTSALALGQNQQEESKEDKKLRERQDKLSKKEEDRKEKETKVRSKEAKKYNTLREFAEDQYASEVDFRDEVDRAYLDLQGQHALQAYQINTTRTTELVSPETDDRTLKIRRVLYDNPWTQDYVNRVGQQLVPNDSDNLSAFKIDNNPAP